MKKIFLLSILAIGFISSTALHAANAGTYGGIQYGLGSYNQDGFDETKPNVLVGRFGKFVNDKVSIEGRLGLGLQDDTITDAGVEYTFDIDTILGVYGLAHFNVNQTASVYGLIGFSRVEATTSGLGGSGTGTESGLSFGVGANLEVAGDVSLNLEYIQYLNQSDLDLSAVGLGVVIDF